MSPSKRVVVAGGGAAGFFGAIHCKEQDPGAEVTILEKSREVLAKVAISGGGRCNVTHACFDPGQLVSRYPRGSRELRGPFHRWNPRHTVDWFESRGVAIKTEPDGRMFPVTDSSQTIVDCLRDEAQRLGILVQTGQGLETAAWDKSGQYFRLSPGGPAQFLLLATGGNQRSGGLGVANSLGHTIIPPVPSLFTFNSSDPLIDGLSGIAVSDVTVKVSGSDLMQRGPVLITHWGLSGPAILRLSSWGARELAARAYRVELEVNWLGGMKRGQVEDLLAGIRRREGGRAARQRSPFDSLPRRVWERLVDLAGIDPGRPWARLTREQLDELVSRSTGTRLQVSGKSMNKDEFVTCGGVALKEIDMKTMQSRVRPGLYLAGEILDVDGVTGGFNFQAAWTTGYLAGTAMARARG